MDVLFQFLFPLLEGKVIESFLILEGISPNFWLDGNFF